MSKGCAGVCLLHPILVRGACVVVPCSRAHTAGYKVLCFVTPSASRCVAVLLDTVGHGERCQALDCSIPFRAALFSGGPFRDVVNVSHAVLLPASCRR